VSSAWKTREGSQRDSEKVVGRSPCADQDQWLSADSRVVLLGERPVSSLEQLPYILCDVMKHRELEVVIVGGGLAGLSAAIYLGRARRKPMLIHSGRSMAKWEPEVQNYLGFPDGIDGSDLLHRGMKQAGKFHVEIVHDDIQSLQQNEQGFELVGECHRYLAQRVLIATGLTHLPPNIPGVEECLGHSLFFCKDCDAYRVQGKRIVILGCNNEAADYALAMLLFSPSVTICTNGQTPIWDSSHRAWLMEYQVMIHKERIQTVEHEQGQIMALRFDSGASLNIEAAFVTRGDICHSDLVKSVGVELTTDGQIVVDDCLRTTVPNLYAAGCVTTANCQMIIAAGQGAIAAQAINRDLFEEALAEHRLSRWAD
jgi:thioredoxin reductase (NADPH)